jgi:xylulokinase
MLALGIDSGTGSTKSIVLDVSSGEVLAQASRPHQTIEGLPHGHVEQTPQTWIEAVDATARDCISQIGARKEDLRAIGVSGQQHGLVVLDESDRPIRPAKLWSDTCTAAQADELNQAFGGAAELIASTGNAMTPGYTAPKLLWLKQREPANFRRTTSVLLPHDFINFWLTGEKQMEYGDASGTGFMDVRKRTWYKPVLDYIDPSAEAKLPPLGSSRKPAGLLQKSRREAWRLPDGIVVSAGGGDNMMGAIGTGNVAAGVVTVSLGTSGTIYAYAPQPVIDPGGEIAAFCDSTDAWLPLACTMNVGIALDQVRKLFALDFATIEAQIASAAPGAGGIVFLPYLQGERTPNLPAASGVFHGLNTGNMTAPQMARAVVEGVVLGLGYALRRFAELGVIPTEIRLIGGGSKSAVTRQIAADVFGCPIVTLQSPEAAALGAAIQAAWTYAQTSAAPVALETLVHDNLKLTSSRVEPRQAEGKVYADLLVRHTSLTRALKANGFL